MKSLPSTIFGCLLMAGCVSPDISDNLQTVQQAYSLGAPSVRAALAQDAKAERAAEQARLAAERLPIFEKEGQCLALGLTPIEGCTLVEVFDPPIVANRATITASEAIAGLDAIDNYLESLVLLADANPGPDISAQTTSLLEATNQLSQAANSNALAPISKDTAAFVAETAGYLTEQARLRRLKSVVRRGDAVLDLIIADIVGRLETSTGSEALRNLETAMNSARDHGTPAEYVAAATAYREAFTSHYEAQTKSPANLLRLLRAAHADLLNRLNNPSVEEMTTAIERIQTIRDLAEQTKGTTNE